jgi:hypothetical protein
MTFNHLPSHGSAKKWTNATRKWSSSREDPNDYSNVYHNDEVYDLLRRSKIQLFPSAATLIASKVGTGIYQIRVTEFRVNWGQLTRKSFNKLPKSRQIIMVTLRSQILKVAKHFPKTRDRIVCLPTFHYWQGMEVDEMFKWVSQMLIWHVWKRNCFEKTRNCQNLACTYNVCRDFLDRQEVLNLNFLIKS